MKQVTAWTNCSTHWHKTKSYKINNSKYFLPNLRTSYPRTTKLSPQNKIDIKTFKPDNKRWSHSLKNKCRKVPLPERPYPPKPSIPLKKHTIPKHKWGMQKTSKIMCSIPLQCTLIQITSQKLTIKSISSEFKLTHWFQGHTLNIELKLRKHSLKICFSLWMKW